MKKILIGLLITSAFAAPVAAGTIYLNADTAATGSQLDTTPLVTPYGTITFNGEFNGDGGDNEFIDAGATGYSFDVAGGGAVASLTFDFDVSAFEFIFGGNNGDIRVTAYDALNNVVDEFYQADTANGQFAGPKTLSGNGIRRIGWHDSDGNFAALDNITITTAEVPEPAMLGLFGLGAIGIGLSRRRRAA